MAKAILRFAKHKGSPAAKLEGHHERKKEKYKSNPDIDASRSKYNVHLITPQMSYKKEIDTRITEAKCRTRKDSVRFIDTLITASPEFFKGKSYDEMKRFFIHGLDFIKAHIVPESIFSAVIHLDEKTPHMHLCFVPLTEDKRLCAKEILGNSTKMVEWQDKFYEHMVKFYPKLERGESARDTHRKHIPTSVFKAAYRLQKMQLEIESILENTNILNTSKNTTKVAALIKKFVPKVESFETQVNMLSRSFKRAEEENAELSKALNSYKDRDFKQSRELADLKYTVNELYDFLNKIPAEIIEQVKEAEKQAQKERRRKREMEAER